MSGIRFVRLIAKHTRDVNAAILQAARQDTDVLLVAGTAWFGGPRPRIVEMFSENTDAPVPGSTTESRQ